LPFLAENGDLIGDAFDFDITGNSSIREAKK
jgi:hypothetical protein